MGIDFESGSSEGLYSGAVSGLSAPFSIALWFRVDDTDSTYVLASVGDSAGTHYTALASNSATNQLWARTYDHRKEAI